MSEYGYIECMQEAGAVIHASESWGSYQGDWAALVTYQGVTGFVWDYFGSCSYCDPYEGSIGDWFYDHCPNRYDDGDTCEEDRREEYNEARREFGRGYLEGLLTYEQALERAQQHSWDPTTDEMTEWITRVWREHQEDSA